MQPKLCLKVDRQSMGAFCDVFFAGVGLWNKLAFLWPSDDDVIFRGWPVPPYRLSILLYMHTACCGTTSSPQYSALDSLVCREGVGIKSVPLSCSVAVEKLDPQF